MGGLLSTLFNFYPISGRESRILMLGLDGAGKTTMLYQLKLGEIVQTIPTVGFNVESIKVDKLTLTIWDASGQERLRPLWRHFYKNCIGLIFVIDSVDKSRMSQAKDMLHGVLRDIKNDMPNGALLIYANKQGEQKAMLVSEIRDELDLTSIKHLEWHIQGSCALTGEGLKEGLKWLVRKL
ncbi:hypothetical protein BGX26_010826 [Mortierella sp. AD094]|nr:hypothetical protein BGX26_010826 [Mortierella sp. AD094]